MVKCCHILPLFFFLLFFYNYNEVVVVFTGVIVGNIDMSGDADLNVLDMVVVLLKLFNHDALFF